MESGFLGISTADSAPAGGGEAGAGDPGGPGGALGMLFAVRSDPRGEKDPTVREVAPEDEEEGDSEGFETISEGDEEEIGSDFGSNDSEEEDEVGHLPRNFGEVETKSRFTDYSLSSSVIRRNDQLSLLDDRFEKV